MPTKIAVTMKEAHELSGIPPESMRKLIRSRKIEVARVGRKILIPVIELERICKPGAILVTK